ncbi:GTP 3',8-cyclase MoaA [Sandaracinobacter neustonicus]|uniref:GTP 3',8-cyclase n=1 Tax=Sandaracinobacter neustonicus TaxID=1715348 RepID=A0A501XF21_9SPHN|nr:GTP 3',8-cyclase MoaA [Sandaracinobacter neustonicus]TPE59238.1 GTP 3',8-cyclase MoaA [Sandaracinobacter neustonicus]
MSARPLIDGFGRRISYVRLSVTDRCDFRCTYCMPDSMTFLPKREVLTLEELDAIGSAFVARGVSRIRLTGGEPLVRRGLIGLVQSLSRHLGAGLDELTLTTNASQLASFAEPLRAAGIRRVNVSLDSLDPGRFRQITRRGELAPVLEGIAAAKAAGLRVKINMVALKGLNEDEILPMAAWCAGHGFDLSFIETMPLGLVEEDRTDRYLPLTDVRRALQQRLTLVDSPERTGGPARYVRVAETGQRLGFITPLTHNFCESCNRVRVTATGTLFMCLGQESKVELRDILRHEGPAALDAALDRAMQLKPKGHDFRIDRRAAPPAVPRHMSMTGG